MKPSKLIEQCSPPKWHLPVVGSGWRAFSYPLKSVYWPTFQYEYEPKRKGLASGTSRVAPPLHSAVMPGKRGQCGARKVDANLDNTLGAVGAPLKEAHASPP